MIRTFIAVAVTPETCEELGREIAYLKACLPRIRWVLAENLHLTLKFFGNVPDKDLPEIFQAANEAAAGATAFTLDIERLGCFPDSRRPRVIWAGCGAGADQLTQLAERVEAACCRRGYARDRRRFSPHLTIGRVKQPRDAEGLSAPLEDARRTLFGSVDVAELVVCMSELKKSGAVYTPMHRAPLGEPGA